MDKSAKIARRNFMASVAGITAGGLFMPSLVSASTAKPKAEDNLFSIGPRDGYSEHIGTLVSMMNYMRSAVFNFTGKLSTEQLDYLIDDQANSIGAILLHLAATEKFYQVNTFEGRQEFNSSEKKIWEAPMSLGNMGRKKIKGNDLDHYVNIMTEVREETLEVFKTKDDEWLMEVDQTWSNNERTFNTYWKWFHVCEHESNHGGQIKFLRSRLPGIE